MKKLALTTVCALAMTSAAFAQGTIQWVPAGSSLIFQTNAVNYSPLFGGAAASGPGTGTIGNVPTGATQSFYYMLLDQGYSGVQATAPTTLSQLNGWSVAWSDPTVYATNGTLANGRPVMTPGSDTGQTVNWAAGTTNSIMMVGWSANLGTTWSAVSNSLANWATVQGSVVGEAFVGFSSTGFINPGSVNPGQTIFGTPVAASYGNLIYNPSASAGQLYLLPVPEPATMALMGLGGLSLLLFRRQRKS